MTHAMTGSAAETAKEETATAVLSGIYEAHERTLSALETCLQRVAPTEQKPSNAPTESIGLMAQLNDERHRAIEIAARAEKLRDLL